MRTDEARVQVLFEEPRLVEVPYGVSIGVDVQFSGRMRFYHGPRGAATRASAAMPANHRVFYDYVSVDKGILEHWPDQGPVMVANKGLDASIVCSRSALGSAGRKENGLKQRGGGIGRKSAPPFPAAPVGRIYHFCLFRTAGTLWHGI